MQHPSHDGTSHDGAPPPAPEHLRALRVRNVYEQSEVGVFVNFALSALLIALLRDAAEPVPLLTWFAVLNGIGLLRLNQRGRFLRDPAPWPSALWENRFRLMLCASALVWGLGAVMLVGSAPFETQFVIFLVLTGLCAGGIVNLSPVLSCYVLYVPLMLVPMTLWCLTQDNSAYHTLGLMGLVFGFALLSAGRNYSRHFNRSAELAGALQASEGRLRRIIDLVPVKIFARDQSGQFLLANEATASFFGRSVDELTFDRLGSVMGDEAQTRALLAGDAALLEDRVRELVTEDVVEDARGRSRVLRTTRVQFDDPTSGRLGVLGVAVDVTDERQVLAELRETEARFSSAFYNAPIGMMLVAVDGTVVTANRVAEEIFEAEEGTWAGQQFWCSAETADADAIAGQFTAALNGTPGGFQLETRHTTRDDRTIWVMLTASAVPQTADSEVRAIVQLQDISATHRMADQLAYQATHDSLTDLISRREAEKRIERALESVRIDRTQHALLYLDLDKFKVVNDSCGHAAGDALLVEVAGLLKSLVRKHDSVARLGGDEFAILLEHCTSAQATAIAAKINKALFAHCFTWNDKVFNSECSVGIVEIAAADTTVDNVIKAADAACHAAKELGRNGVYLFRADDEDLNRHRSQIDTVSALNVALELDRFELHAQPIQSAGGRGDVPSHIEIPVRMRDEAGDVIAPGLFLPAAEHYGVAPKIDRWVIHNTCAWFVARPECLELIELCSINVSGQSLTDPDFQHYIESQFRCRRAAAGEVLFRDHRNRGDREYLSGARFH